MKKLICSILTAALLVPVVSFAQADNGPVTRAQVRAELVQLEQAGYQPASRQNHYPDEIQAAEARVQATNSGYGGVAATGAPAVPASMPVAHAAN